MTNSAEQIREEQRAIYANPYFHLSGAAAAAAVAGPFTIKIAQFARESWNPQNHLATFSNTLDKAITHYGIPALATNACFLGFCLGSLTVFVVLKYYE